MLEMLISPPGLCLYANILRPRGKENKITGVKKMQYGIVLQLDNPELDPKVAAFIGSLHNIFVEKFGKGAIYGPNGRPWKKEASTDEVGMTHETGVTRITFNRDILTRGGAELPPPSVEDAANQPWPSTVAIGNGSLVKVGFSAYLWDSQDGGKGLSLNLLAVRILRHSPYVIEAVAPGAFGAPEEGARANSPEVQALAGGASDTPWNEEPADNDIPF